MDTGGNTCTVLFARGLKLNNLRVWQLFCQMKQITGEIDKEANGGALPVQYFCLLLELHNLRV